MENPGLDIEKNFNDLCSLATSLSQVFAFAESHSEVYATYGLKRSEEEVIFCEEYIEPSPSLVLGSPNLVLGSSSLVWRSSA